MATIAPTTALIRPRNQWSEGAALAALGGRALLAPIFLLSGIGKISDVTMYLGYIKAFGLPFPAVALAGAVALEMLGGLALLLGYRTRLIGTMLALFSIATALIFHEDLGNSDQFLHFWKNLAMAGGLLQLAAFGGGKLSIDGRGR
jgi:putative oxidoreductase